MRVLSASELPFLALPDGLLEREQLCGDDNQQQRVHVVKQLDHISKLMLGPFAEAHFGERLAQIADLEIIVHSRIGLAAQPGPELEKLLGRKQWSKSSPVQLEKFRICRQCLVYDRREWDSHQLLEFGEYFARAAVRFAFADQLQLAT